jgi:hypothetical protein
LGAYLFFGSNLSQENCKHDQRISALDNMTKVRLQESPAAIQLPLVERNELGLQANDILRCAEDQAACNSVTRQQVKKTSDSFTPGAPLGQGPNEFTILRCAEDQATCNSVTRQQVKKASDSFTSGAPLGQGPNEFTNVQSTSRDVLTLDSQLSRECNSHLDLVGGRNRSVKDSGHIVHEWPEETSKAAESPKRSRKQLTSVSELSVSLKLFKEKQSRDNDCGQSVNVDWNQVKIIIYTIF